MKSSLLLLQASFSICSIALSTPVRAFTPPPPPPVPPARKHDSIHCQLLSSKSLMSSIGMSTRALTTRTRQSKLSLSSSSSSSSDDDFMASLKNRMEEVQNQETKCPLIVLDSMLPRQIMKIQVKNNPLFIDLIKNQIEKETPTFGMVGMVTLKKTGQQINLNNGVEVEIMEKPSFIDDNILLVLKATRRFAIKGEVQNADQGWTEARVEYLDSDAQEDEELNNGDDRMAVARAIMKAKELTSPNAIMDDNLSLINRWIELAKENERVPGQIDQLLEELGDIPDEHEPTERALWVGALINPLPAMGVAMEIRPALLEATTAEKRVEVACEGILKSIRHMDGSAPMW